MSNKRIPKIYIGELIAQSGETVVKIGMTIGDPMARLTKYAAKYGYRFSRDTARVAVFTVTPKVMRGVEYALHNTFKGARIGTQEVFRVSFETAVRAAKKLTGREPD